MEMPSETETVPNCSGYPPPPCTPSLAACARRSSERLHGVISFHELAMPICGLSQSASPMPTARSIPREVMASMPSVTILLLGLMSGSPCLVSDTQKGYPPAPPPPARAPVGSDRLAKCRLVLPFPRFGDNKWHLAGQGDARRA